MSGHLIRSVVFDDGGVTIEYAAFDDVRGELICNHVLRIPHEGDYDQEIEAVSDALDALLVDALEDFRAWRPTPLPSPDEDEDEDEDEDD